MCIVHVIIKTKQKKPLDFKSSFTKRRYCDFHVKDPISSFLMICRWSKPSCVSKLFYSASFLNGKFLRGAITNLFVHITSEIWDLKTQFLFYANQWFLGVMTTVVRSDVGTGCKGSWQICCFIVQRRGGKNRNVHVFPFRFYCFSLLGFLFRQFDHLYFESNSITSNSTCSSNKLIFVFQLRAIHERD